MQRALRRSLHGSLTLYEYVFLFVYSAASSRSVSTIILEDATFTIRREHYKTKDQRVDAVSKGSLNVWTTSGRSLWSDVEHVHSGVVLAARC